ncbi:hypothetical protein K443DRAFT_106056 [Laccaria amethystina LaAM-08-1]|uniref:Uncharacterized protein n=1 Tax=Laccaria amethystina LaAM-08-1 TaxID=1095629 RepID=A0A0C9WWY4_9AGAR|nr:hypothetical protein K443DRAFT_106056 [Laccaria amethystina LaAM-08-1]
MPVTHLDATNAVLIPQLPSRRNWHPPLMVWQAFNSRSKARHKGNGGWLFWVSNSPSKT